MYAMITLTLLISDTPLLDCYTQTFRIFIWQSLVMCRLTCRGILFVFLLRSLRCGIFLSALCDGISDLTEGIHEFTRLLRLIAA
jgi:hypothetical protein